MRTLIVSTLLILTPSILATVWLMWRSGVLDAHIHKRIGPLYRP